MSFLNKLFIIAVSCVPFIEVKGSIPIAMAMGMDKWTALLLAQIGSILVSLVLLLLLRPVMTWMKSTELFHKLAHKVERLGEKKGEKVKSKMDESTSHSKRIWAMVIGVFVFVAVPLPGTGVWAGSLIATILNIPLKYSVPAVILGNVVASVIMVAFSSVFFKIV